MTYLIEAQNSTGRYYVGAFSAPTLFEAIQAAHQDWMARLKTERQPKLAQMTWVYKELDAQTEEDVA